MCRDMERGDFVSDFKRLSVYKEAHEGGDMDEKFFYQRLVQLRMQKDVSAREMSLSLGMSPGYINTLESQKALPSMAVFFYICEYLGVTPSQFFDDGNQCPQELKSIVEVLKELTPEQVSHLEYIARQMKK